MVDVVRFQARVVYRLFERRFTSSDQVTGYFLKLRSSELIVKMQRAAIGGGNERQVDLSGLFG